MSLDFTNLRLANLSRCSDSKGFNHQLHDWSVAEWGNAAAGELGEACNIAKKMIRFRGNVRGNDPTKTVEDYRKMLASEIAGALIYLDLWSAAAGIDLAQAVIDEFNKKSDEIGYPVKL